MQYQTKPIPVSAIRIPSTNPNEDVEAWALLFAWLMSNSHEWTFQSEKSHGRYGILLGGVMLATGGDWIVLSPGQGCFSCDSDHFEATYDKA